MSFPDHGEYDGPKRARKKSPEKPVDKPATLKEIREKLDQILEMLKRAKA